MSDEEIVHPNRAPAVKAGGMRIVKHPRENVEKPLSRSELAKQEAEYNTEVSVISPQELLTKDERDFHDKTVRAHQEKPKPCLIKPHTDPSKRIIQQPMK